MKMQPEMFESLKRDFFLVAQAGRRALTLCDAWEVFHQMYEDRGFDDSHPFFATGQRVRVLSYDGRHGCDAYYDAGLNDSHIETALRKVIAS